MTHRLRKLLFSTLLVALPVVVGSTERMPLIDAHVHTWFPAMAAAYPDARYSNEQVLEDYGKLLAELNIERIVLSGADLTVLKPWQERYPDRVIPALMIDGPLTPEGAENIRRWVKAGRLAVLGEVGLQYSGYAPNDSIYDPYYALAVELDVPIAIHMGHVTPAKTLLQLSSARVSKGDPLLLEDALAKYPTLRVQVMHAGWPFTEHMIAIMIAYPNVYVDLANNGYAFGPNDLRYHLKRLIDAGLGKRILWGSDTSGPFEIDRAVRESLANILDADFLTTEQKRDIVHDNAVRFFRLDRPPVP